MIEDAIKGLKKELKEYSECDKGQIAKMVADTGFHCKRCGKCCKNAWGDNTVSVFPGEVRAIAHSTGMEWLEVAMPMESSDVDEHGEYHTFEWALQKQKNGDCKFLKDGVCTVYQVRPLICRTYPMRLGSGLELYECDGLGSGPMLAEEAERFAETLHERQVRETGETILLLERFKPFHPSTRDNSGDKLYIVHDSEGSRRVLARADGGFSFL
jgi:uncharacterized protein